MKRVLLIEEETNMLWSRGKAILKRINPTSFKDFFLVFMILLMMASWQIEIKQYLRLSCLAMTSKTKLWSEFSVIQVKSFTSCRRSSGWDPFNARTLLDYSRFYFPLNQHQISIRTKKSALLIGSFFVYLLKSYELRCLFFPRERQKRRYKKVGRHKNWRGHQEAVFLNEFKKRGIKR